MAIVCGQLRVCVFGGGLSADYLLPEVGRVEPRWGNLQAASIGGAFLKGSRMAKLNVSSSPPGAENPRKPPNVHRHW